MNGRQLQTLMRRGMVIIKIPFCLVDPIQRIGAIEMGEVHLCRSKVTIIKIRGGMIPTVGPPELVGKGPDGGQYDGDKEKGGNPNEIGGREARV